ncbi:MAG: ribonuclease H-like domain-containing protein [Patescibacteria group bacterium]|nr:ribonuclease H-like domain-containing protein [Patescibacteria group bacterium]MDE1944499.1 ribonuclease H-like domain-containing protein [Patescibacteria group bacterium]MDE1945400.1 ribonuclease H-like domain-containing protein [Patescibacteria group bacterium]MDE2057765.1 ribonuclease H-like domain-containing protein [Patescibacteria group bacterium]
MRAITLDIESISDSAVRGRVDVAEQELTVVAIHDSETGAFSAFTREELPALWPILEAADLLVGFNSDTFDIPLLNRYYPGDLARIRSLDLLSEVAAALGRRIRLQSLAEATLKAGKSGDGLKAQDWWRAGRYEEVKKYCIEDVRLTRKLFDYALEHGSLKYKDLREIREIKLDTAHWLAESPESATLTHALPL